MDRSTDPYHEPPQSRISSEDIGTPHVEGNYSLAPIGQNTSPLCIPHPSNRTLRRDLSHPSASESQHSRPCVRGMTLANANGNIQDAFGGPSPVESPAHSVFLHGPITPSDNGARRSCRTRSRVGLRSSSTSEPNRARRPTTHPPKSSPSLHHLRHRNPRIISPNPML